MRINLIGCPKRGPSLSVDKITRMDRNEYDEVLEYLKTKTKYLSYYAIEPTNTELLMKQE